MEKTHMNMGKGQSKCFVYLGATEHLTNEPKQTYLLVIFIMD